MRAADRPSWKECFKLSWIENRWLMATFIGLCPVMGTIFPRLIYTKEGFAAYQAAGMEWKMAIIFACFGAFMSLMVYLMRAQVFRDAETPLEREARERRQLAQLKDKYGE